MDETKEKLTRFYNKFNENKRLDTLHGQVEFFTSMKYIHDYLKPGDRIADIGAGPGKYSLFLKQEGYDVTAVELVRPNIGMLRAKDKEIRIIEADARDLHMLKDREFDAVILFGPMYHLYSFEDRLQALKEAARICKRVLFVTYIMNEYALIQYAFKENNYSLIRDKLDKDFRICDPDGIFFQSRLEEMDELNKACGLKLLKRFAADGATDYMRSTINQMDEETFKAYIDFHMATCERTELLGASSHVTDILEAAED